MMLPIQIGAMTIDGTWLIAIGIILVVGIIYKNRNNISLTSSQTNVNTDSNVSTAIEKNSDIENTEVKENNMEVLNEEKLPLEKEEILN